MFKVPKLSIKKVDLKSFEYLIVYIVTALQIWKFQFVCSIFQNVYF